MDKVKQTIHYWCDDIRNGRCTGDKIGIAVLDTGLSPHPDLSGRVKAFETASTGKRHYMMKADTGRMWLEFCVEAAECREAPLPVWLRRQSLLL